MTEDEILEIGFALEEGGLSHSEIDAYFAHYGKPGMKWGVRRSRRPANAKQQRARDNQILVARGRVNGGKNRQRYMDARKQYKADKQTMGKAAAKRIFDKAKLRNVRDLQVANTAKDGKEFASMLLTDALSLGSVSAFNVGVNLRAKQLERKVSRRR